MNRAAYTDSPDAGESWVLLDVAGQPLRTWKTGDPHEIAVRRTYDKLRRPVGVYVSDEDVTSRHDEPVDLYEVIRHRYERGAMVITSNRATEEWYPLFGDPLMAGAAMDRLLHHSHVVELTGDSYRNPPTNRRTQPG